MDDSRIEEIIRRTIEATHQHTRSENERIKKTVDKMHDTLYGNGKEGLTTTVDRLERAVEAAQEIWMKVVSSIVLAIVIGAIILIVQANLLK